MARCRLVAAVGAALILALPAGASAQQVSPVKQCATYNAKDGTVRVRLAAVNTNVFIVTTPPGDANYLMPPPIDRNQPNQFVPGLTTYDLSLRADSGAVNWFLGGVGLAAPFSTAAAGLPFERPCAYEGPEITGVEPAALPAGDGTLTVFGQGLGAGATVTIDGVATDVAPSAATDNRLDVPVTDAQPGTHDLLVTDADGNRTGCRGCVRIVAPEPAPQPLPGPQGPRGETGPPGAPATAATPRTQTARAKTVRAGRLVTSTVACPAGTTALSGGYDLAPARAKNPPLVTQNRPAGTGWRVTARGATRARASRLTAYAVCG